MSAPPPDWETRIAEAWREAEQLAPADLRARIDAIAAERPEGDAIAAFERACVRDSTGDPAAAAQLYRQALAQGVQGIRRRRATIQLASSLRNLGQPEEAVALLSAERAQPSDELDHAVAAFLALALIDLGREREAAGLALGALAAYLPRYNRSLANYAQKIVRE